MLTVGLLLAMGATTARAHPKAPAVTPSAKAAAQPAAPIDLTLHPAMATQAIPIAPALGLAIPPAAKPAPLTPSAPAAASQPTPAVITLQTASDEVKRVARWVIDTRDNLGLPFVLIDKVNAQVFAFSPAGLLQGAAPVLLGMGRGDRLIASNDVKMEAMPPQVRITPAGRFVSRLAIDSHGKELLVLDYDASISLHAVLKGTPKEHRAERLNSPTADDNRISFGCINVPTTFYSTIVSPAFAHTKGIVYVLPETSPASQLFGFQPFDAGTVSGALPSAADLSPRAAQAAPAPAAR